MPIHKPARTDGNNRSLRYITMDQLVASAKMNLGLEHDRFRNKLREWVNDANRSIGTSKVNLIESDPIPVRDLAFDAPCNMVEPLVIVLISGEQRYVYPLYVSDSSMQDFPALSDIDNSTLQRPVTITEQADQFILNSGSKNIFSHAIVRYYGLPLDEFGEPLVPEYRKRAVEAYCEYMYNKMMRNRSRGRPESIPQSEVQFAYGQWIILKKDAITNKNRVNVLEADEVVRNWQTMLPRPTSKNTRKWLFNDNIR